MEREPDEAGMSAVERLTVTVTQAAVMLGISRTSAYERVRRDEIPTVRLGRRLLVPKAALQTERRRHQSILRRLDGVRAELDGLRTTGARREEELELLREGFAELGAENAALRARIALTAPTAQPQGLNRADRRRNAKRGRYKG